MTTTVETSLELKQYGLVDLSLLDGEKVESTLRLNGSGDGAADVKPDLVLLTNQRVIHVHDDKRGRRAVFASIHDVDVVEVSLQQEGNGVYVWAGLAFVVAALLWFVIDGLGWRVAASLTLAAMGIYLVADHLMSPGTPILTFKTRSTEFSFDLGSGGASSQVYDFINRLFQIKNAGANGLGPRYFAPR